MKIVRRLLNLITANRDGTPLFDIPYFGVVLVLIGIGFLIWGFVGCTRRQPPIADAIPTPTPTAVSTPSVAFLEAGYSKAAESLGAKLRFDLADPTVQEKLLIKSRQSEAGAKKLQAIFARRNGPKFAPDPEETLVRIAIANITAKPPSLVEDKSDLYNRYKSSVKMLMKIDDPKSISQPTNEGMFNFDLEFPASANPDGIWTFPSDDTVLCNVFQKCDEGPRAFYNHKTEFYLGLLKP